MSDKNAWPFGDDDAHGTPAEPEDEFTRRMREKLQYEIEYPPKHVDRGSKLMAGVIVLMVFIFVVALIGKVTWEVIHL